MFQFFLYSSNSKELRKSKKKKSDSLWTIRLSRSRKVVALRQIRGVRYHFLRNLIPSYIYYNLVYLPGKLDRIARFPTLWSICGRDRFPSASSILIRYTNTRNTLNSKRALLAISATKKTDQAVASKPVARKYRRIAAATRSTNPLLKDRTREGTVRLRTCRWTSPRVELWD